MQFKVLSAGGAITGFPVWQQSTHKAPGWLAKFYVTVLHSKRELTLC